MHTSIVPYLRHIQTRLLTYIGRLIPFRSLFLEHKHDIVHPETLQESVEVNLFRKYK